MKKLGILLLACITALNLSALNLSAKKIKIGKFTFKIETPTTVELHDVDKDITNVFLSETIDYEGKTYTITSIGYQAFKDCKSLTSVTIPNCVTSILGGAFAGCSALKSMAIPKGVTIIGEGVFKGTALYNNPANWENGALYINNCLIKVAEGFVGHFRIKENTRFISVGAFKDCSALKSVTIPKSVTSIGWSAFEGCSALTSVIIPNSVKSIEVEAFSGCSALTSVTIPNSVTVIGEEAFSGCSALTSVTIPNSVTVIGEEAFSGCSALTSVTIPNSVIFIGEEAFSGCSALKSVTIPNSVTAIVEGAFEGTALYNNPANWENGALYIDDCLIKVDEGFVGHFRIKENTRVIAYCAFYDCESLTSVTIPNSVTSIGYWAFRGTALYNDPSKWENGALYIDNCLIETNNSFVGYFRIKENTRVIADQAFSGCSALTSVTIPNSVTSIGNYAFAWCRSLTSVNIPNSVTSIGMGAFEGCSSLTSVTIPNSVTSIGFRAFPEHTQIIRQ